MKSVKLLGVALLVAVMASCCPCLKNSYMDQFDKLVGSEWKLVQKDGRDIAADGRNNYTLAFSKDNRVSGVADCNRYSGVMAYMVTQNAQKFSISQIASTRMACPDMAGENEFLEFLKGAHRVNIDGDLLIMLSNDAAKKERRWVFEKVK